jgi:hypothetical protein
MGYRKIWITIPASRAWVLDYYQPQVDSNFHELDWRMAITITPPGGKEIVGAVTVDGLTSVNPAGQSAGRRPARYDEGPR